MTEDKKWQVVMGARFSNMHEYEIKTSPNSREHAVKEMNIIFQAMEDKKEMCRVNEGCIVKIPEIYYVGLCEVKQVTSPQKQEKKKSRNLFCRLFNV